MIKISGIILAKNEENMIADAIDSLSFCDEVIVVDNESTDRTSDLAKKLGAIVVIEKSQSFAKLREIGKDKASADWLLYLDADERIDKELAKSIQQVINNSAEEIGYRLQRKNYYLGNHEWPKIEKFKRLFKKLALKKWEGVLHETPIVTGKIGDLSGYINHYTHRDLTSMLEKTNKWSDMEAKLRFDVHHPKMTWWRFPRVMLTAFFESYIIQQGWRIGTAGLIESIYQAFSIFITYAKLWELQQNADKKI